MKLKLLFILISFFCASIIQAQQTFTGAGGTVPDGGVEVCFNAAVTGVGVINNTYGLKQVCIDVEHTWVEDLTIFLVAPDGTRIELTSDNGGDGDDYDNTCFTMTASSAITAGSAPFAGTYLPEGDLTTANNGQNADGTWQLCGTDNGALIMGDVISWNITFDSLQTITIPAGTNCANPIVVGNLPFSQNNQTTCGFGNQYSSTNSPCGSTYLNGEEVVYTYTPTANEAIVIDLTNTATNTAIFLFEGCPDDSACIASATSTGGNPILTANLVGGTTYFIVVDSKPGTNCTPYNIDIYVSVAPTIQDCDGAIAICQNIYTETNAYTGEGNFPNEINSGNSCLGSGENNDVWYVFTVESPGTFCFTITPNSPSDDYDWAVYDMTNADCGDIFNDPSLEVSCNYDLTPGPTGPNGGLTPNSEPCLNVLGEETYVLSVSQFTTSLAGYTIDFSQGTAGIFDNRKPFISDIYAPNCGENSISFDFNEREQCSSVAKENFTINGPGGPYSVDSLVGNACAIGADQENTFTVYFSPALPVSGGNFQFNLVNGSNPVVDLCGNQANDSAYNFTIFAPPTLDTLFRECGPSGLNYALNLRFSGGDTSSYIVTGSPNGTWISPTEWLSDTLNSGDPYNVTFSDADNCSPINITGAFACNCVAASGTMNMDTLYACEDANAVAVYNTAGEAFGGNDTLSFVLHEGTSSSISNLITHNPTTSFGFDPSMSYGVTYYISAVVGLHDTGGLVDLNDPCLAVSPGQPVVFFQNPEGSITATPSEICNGQTTNIKFDFVGTGPFNVVLNDGTSNINLNNVLNGQGFDYSPMANTTYTLVSFTDNSPANCTGTIITATADVIVNDAPMYSMPADIQLCYGEDATVVVSHTGVAPFNYTYTQSNIAGLQIVNGEMGNTSSIPVNNVSENIEIRLIVASDAGGCPAIINDTNTIITVYNAPTATATGPGAICAGNTDFIDINFTGNGPFNFTYTLNGAAQTPITGVNNPYQLPITQPGTYVIQNIEDANCTNSTSSIEIIVTGEIVDASFTFNPDPAIVNGRINFNANNTQYQNYTWDFGNGDVGTGASKSHIYDKEGEYIVCLTASQNGGCENTVCATVNVSPLVIFVPSAFTPDGDGTNELFGPVLANHDDEGYLFQIFDRWGQKVFETTNPDKYWDGKIHLANKISFPIQPGVYVWKISVRALDSYKTIELDGSVTIIK